MTTCTFSLLLYRSRALFFFGLSVYKRRRKNEKDRTQRLRSSSVLASLLATAPLEGIAVFFSHSGACLPGLVFALVRFQQSLPRPTRSTTPGWETAAQRQTNKSTNKPTNKKKPHAHAYKTVMEASVHTNNNNDGHGYDDDDIVTSWKSRAAVALLGLFGVGSARRTRAQVGVHGDGDDNSQNNNNNDDDDSQTEDEALVPQQPLVGARCDRRAERTAKRIERNRRALRDCGLD
nr:hypothetical protein [Pandoravirus massiliensis]